VLFSLPHPADGERLDGSHQELYYKRLMIVKRRGQEANEEK